MNTSFAPRIDRNRWDFHDGIDLPAPIGASVDATRAGTVFRAGPGGVALRRHLAKRSAVNEQFLRETPILLTCSTNSGPERRQAPGRRGWLEMDVLSHKPDSRLS
jgi:hypothetical protein